MWPISATHSSVTSVGNTADFVVSDAVGGSVVFENNKATVVLGKGGVDDNEATVVFGSDVDDDNEAIVVFGSNGAEDNEATLVFGSGTEGLSLIHI